jgi:hypothetical protein
VARAANVIGVFQNHGGDAFLGRCAFEYSRGRQDSRREAAKRDHVCGQDDKLARDPELSSSRL